MKTLFTTTLILFSFWAMGQSKAKIDLSNQETLSNANISSLNSTATSAFAGHLQFQTYQNLQPAYYSFSGGINGKEMLRIHIPGNKIPFDSLILNVRKSQTRWLNDSTMVVTK